MNAAYHFSIVRHPADVLKLLKQLPREENDRQPLVLFASGGNGVGLQFGYLIPAEYMGILGLLQFDPASTIVPLVLGEARMQVVFPPTGLDRTAGQSAILDQLRPSLTQFGRVEVVLELDRLRQDLPPMEVEDSVRIFWEMRDHLGAEDLERFEYLTERVENEGAAFSGFQFYSRGSSNGDLTLVRRKEVQALFPPELCPEMIEMDRAAA